MKAAPTEQLPIPTSPESSIVRHKVGTPSPEPREEITLAAPSQLPTTLISFLLLTSFASQPYWEVPTYSCHFMKGITLPQYHSNDICGGHKEQQSC